MRYYHLKFRDPVTYVNKERYQSLREAVNALLHSEKVELPRTPDSAFEFEYAPSGVPDEFTNTIYDRMDAASFASKRPNREAANATEQVVQPNPDLALDSATSTDGQ